MNMNVNFKYIIIWKVIKFIIIKYYIVNVGNNLLPGAPGD